MKQIKLMAAAFTLSGMLLFSSCNSGDESNSSNPPATPDTATAKKPEPPAKPSNVMIIKQKVANYTKWKQGYDAHDSARLASGLHNFVIARGVSDSNMVMVALKMDDAEKAKTFATSADLKMAMQKAGVIGMPSIAYLDVQSMDSSTNASTTRVMVTHKVKDWDAWKKEFDSHKQARTDAGITDRSLGYELGNNKMVTVVGAVSDLKKAEAFFASKDLKDKMAAAGVDGPPTIFFYNVVQKY